MPLTSGRQLQAANFTEILKVNNQKLKKNGKESKKRMERTLVLVTSYENVWYH